MPRCPAAGPLLWLRREYTSESLSADQVAGMLGNRTDLIPPHRRGLPRYLRVEQWVTRRLTEGVWEKVLVTRVHVTETTSRCWTHGSRRVVHVTKRCGRSGPLGSA